MVSKEEEMGKSEVPGPGPGLGLKEEESSSLPGVDNVKRGRGLLSFRSRKLLLSSLSKSSAANVKANDQVIGRRASDATTTSGVEAIPLLRDDGIVPKGVVRTIAAVEHVDPTKARRELWNPRKVESDSASAKAAKAKVHERRTSEKGQKQAQRVQDSNADTVLKDDVEAFSPKHQLPPSLKLLETFFEGLEAASSLLRIRRQMCTFKAVRKVVEAMSKRRFLLKHLAQIKHLFPEALQLEYVRCKDPDSWGEKWDLRVTLLALSTDCAPHSSSSPLKGSVGQTGATIRRRKEFHARLLGFANSHPDDADIPQVLLPSRPLGGHSNSTTSSSERGATLESSLSDRIGGSDGAASLGSAVDAAESRSRPITVEAGKEDFAFAILKNPSRAAHPPSVFSAGNSHYRPSFSPFFSVQQQTRPADVPSTSQQDDSLFRGSHFPASFRSFFSTRSVVEGGVPPHESGPEETIHSDEEHIREASPLECQFVPTNDEKLPASPASVTNSSDLRERNSCHPPSSPSVVASGANAKIPPQTPTQERVDNNNTASASPMPVHTPCMLSPMDTGFRAAKDSPSTAKSDYPHSDSSRDSLPPPKGQGITRSLKFESPLGSTGPLSSKALNSKPADQVRGTPESSSIVNGLRTKESGLRSLQATPPCTPVQTFSSERKVALENSPFILPHPASGEDISNIPLEKFSASRCLKFDSTPAGGDELKASTAAAAIDRAQQHSQTLELSDPDLASAVSRAAAEAKLFPFASPSNAPTKIPSSERVDFRSPVKTSNLREALCSPSKRTKVNCLAPFEKEGADKFRITSHDDLASSADCGTVPRTKAAVTSIDVDGDGCLPAASTPKKNQLHSTTKDAASKRVSEADFEILQCLPRELIQSVQDKERRMKDENTREFAKQKRRQQMMAGVPKLFNQLRLIFQSLNRSVLPRHELLKGILSSHPDITDNGEVEERLQLIVELAPDYITTRPSQSGELLYRVDKRADVVRIQRRLSGAC